MSRQAVTTPIKLIAQCIGYSEPRCYRAIPKTQARQFTRMSRGYRERQINPLDRLAMGRQKEIEIAGYKRRMKFAGTGLILSFIGVVIITQLLPPPDGPMKTEAPSDSPSFDTSSLYASTTAPANVELIETGTSTIPYFPRTITLPSHQSTKSPALPSGTGDMEAEYTLLGLGIRTVSFLSIQVYVVGFYVSNSDLGVLQTAFVKEGASTQSATTLIAGEKDSLRERLFDHEEGEKIWERVLENNNIRSVIRIVPTRNTDFGHLRDGFERNINNKVRTRPQMADDDRLGEAMATFKAMLGRGKLEKGEEVLLERERQGVLRAWFKGKADTEWTNLGAVQDERISRLMLLGYLSGKTPASESCRRSVIDGVLHVVERPVGTAESEVI